jgi:hypothetical protein
MPEAAIIAGYKGRIDFYYWHGLPIARSWPKSPGRQRSAPVQAQWPAFTTASREWAKLSPAVQEAYNELAHSSGLCGRDLQVRGYLRGLYRYSLP